MKLSKSCRDLLDLWNPTINYQNRTYTQQVCVCSLLTPLRAQATAAAQSCGSSRSSLLMIYTACGHQSVCMQKGMLSASLLWHNKVWDTPWQWSLGHAACKGEQQPECPPARHPAQHLAKSSQPLLTGWHSEWLPQSEQASQTLQPCTEHLCFLQVTPQSECDYSAQASRTAVTASQPSHIAADSHSCCMCRQAIGTQHLTFRLFVASVSANNQVNV